MKENITPDKILMVIRHGERSDKDIEESKRQLDVKLSLLGITQSFESGKLFLQQLKKYNIIKNISDFDFSLVHFKSSPFIRTLQTSTHFFNGIKSEIKKNENDLTELNVNYSLREVMNPLKKKGIIPNNYLHFLYNKDFLSFDEELKKLKITNESINEKYPTDKENYEELDKRCDIYIKQFLSKIEDYKNKKVIVMFCHSGPMKYLLKALGKEIEIKDIQIAEQFYFDISDISNIKFLERIKA